MYFCLVDLSAHLFPELLSPLELTLFSVSRKCSGKEFSYSCTCGVLSQPVLLAVLGLVYSKSVNNQFGTLVTLQISFVSHLLFFFGLKVGVISHFKKKKAIPHLWSSLLAFSDHFIYRHDSSNSFWIKKTIICWLLTISKGKDHPLYRQFLMLSP